MFLKWGLCILVIYTPSTVSHGSIGNYNFVAQSCMEGCYSGIKVLTFLEHRKEVIISLLKDCNTHSSEL